MLIANRYTCIEIIGKGMFGSIYKGINKITNSPVAIKVEKIDVNLKMLKNETKIYRYLSGGEGIPQVLWFGKDETNYYMILELLGISLERTIQNTKGRGFKIDVVKKIANTIFNRIEYIHEKGLIHRDIKPENLLFGIDDNSNILYLIDYGFCKKFILDNGEHIELRKNKTLIGTPNFVSINIHNGLEASRRDDLESVLYIMYYLWKGRLEWNNYQDYYKTVINEKIKMKKLETMEDSETPLIIKQLFQYCRILEFNERPNYSYIYSLLRE